MDDVMHYWVHKNRDFQTNQFSLDETVDLLTAPRDQFPLWIEIEFKESIEGDTVFSLNSSRRFRKYKELKNQDEGYPPFKIVNK